MRRLLKGNCLMLLLSCFIVWTFLAIGNFNLFSYQSSISTRQIYQEESLIIRQQLREIQLQDVRRTKNQLETVVQNDDLTAKLTYNENKPVIIKPEVTENDQYEALIKNDGITAKVLFNDNALVVKPEVKENDLEAKIIFNNEEVKVNPAIQNNDMSIQSVDELYKTPVQTSDGNDEANGGQRNEKTSVTQQDNMLDVDPMFRQLKHFVLFIGYSRSGSSLTGTIFDSHKHVVVAHELNVLKQLKEKLAKENITRNHLFHEIFETSVFQSQNYRGKNGHFGIWNYHIPNTHIGKYEDYIQIIGDKEAEQTSLIMNTASENFDAFQNLIKIPIKFIHVVRNPYDIITTQSLVDQGLRRKNNDLSTDDKPLEIPLQIEGFSRLIEWNKKLRKKFGENVLDVNYSKLLKNPRESLFRICNFLNIECDEDYIKACTQKLNPEESYTRRFVVWSEFAKSKVERIIQNTDFLHGFTFEN